MSKSACLKFPFEEDFQNRTLRRAVSVNEAIASAIRCFLLTSPGQRRGNAIGSFLPGLKHQLIPSASLPGLADELKTELVTQFKGVIFHEVNLMQDTEGGTVNLRVNISFGTPVTEISQLELFI
jgi:hypothetical protein